MKTKVLQALKPKVASLGFTKEELEGVATQLAGNIQEDATEEQITEQVDSVIPYLKLSQSAVTRIVNAKKKEETQPKAPIVSTPTETEKGAEPEDKFEKLMQVIEAQNNKIDALINKDQTATRRAVFASKLKELPEIEQRSKLRLFDRMNFKDNDDFEQFISETEEETAELVKEFSEREVSAMGKPLRGGKGSDKQATDEEAKEVINKLNF